MFTEMEYIILKTTACYTDYCGVPAGRYLNSLRLNIAAQSYANSKRKYIANFVQVKTVLQ